MTDRLKLFCFPFAGATAAVYHRFRRYLPPRIDVVPVEMAGHGSRMKEPLIDSVSGHVDDLLPRLTDQMAAGPFAVFCHSVGTLLAFEVLHSLQEHEGIEPVHVFFSGRHTPDVPSKTSWHQAPDSVFLSMIRGFGGTSQQVLDTPELVELFTTILKSDYKVAETYEYAAPAELLHCPVTAVAGTRDPVVSAEQLRRWGEFTDGPFDVHQLPGGHFYWFDDVAPLCSILMRGLARPSSPDRSASARDGQVHQL